VADFAPALAVYLHEHAHIFGYDGSREFSDALTELLETVVRNRDQLDGYEADWGNLVKTVKSERGKRKAEYKADIVETVAEMKVEELRTLLEKIPPIEIKRALKKCASK
jgi:hypothetical protein